MNRHGLGSKGVNLMETCTDSDVGTRDSLGRTMKNTFLACPAAIYFATPATSLLSRRLVGTHKRLKREGDLGSAVLGSVDMVELLGLVDDIDG